MGRDSICRHAYILNYFKIQSTFFIVLIDFSDFPSVSYESLTNLNFLNIYVTYIFKKSNHVHKFQSFKPQTLRKSFFNSAKIFKSEFQYRTSRD